MTDPILYERDDDGIVVLTLNLPEKRNPISDKSVIEGLEGALARLDDDRDARVAILTGAGSSFSSGGDLKAMKDGSGLRDPSPVRTRHNYKRGIQRLPLAFAACEVPIIAAVNGYAIGAGCDLACMCDLRIAGEGTKFAESFVKLGIIPGDGGAWLLPMVIGHAKAAEMALTGDMIDAQQALAWGLVSQIVPDDELMDAAKTLAKRIAVNPAHAVRMTRRLLWEAKRSDLATILEMSAAMQAISHTTKDHDEAVDAFIEKRKPEFKGD